MKTKQKLKNIKHRLVIKIKKGFTLIELLVVIAIIGLLASVILLSLSNARDSARRATALSNIRQMQEALEIYYNENGFYPPDVNRGWDPGLVKPLPYNASDRTQDCNTNTAACVCGNYLSCTTLPTSIPADWITQVQSHNPGSYIAVWPLTTPWGGSYDYNYWDVGTSRNGCAVPPGIYLGIESGSGFTMDPALEQKLFDQGIDNDGCPSNGEAQLLLVKF